MTEQTGQARGRPGFGQILFRLTRTQFLPLIALPTLVGVAYAYSSAGAFRLFFLALTFLGVALLHLGANAIDDCYDFQNGVDKVANSMFPADFGGWKPLPRNLLSLGIAKKISYLLFCGSLLIAAYLGYEVGLPAFLLGLLGVLLAVFYTAPPLKLDYRGLGLGELAIFFAFGPIPVLGAYYVQTSSLNWNIWWLSLPLGIMTVTILLNHDMIFYEVYRKAGKYSLGATLGRKNTLRVSLSLTALSYIMVLIFVLFRILPVWSLAAPVVSGIVLMRKRGAFGRPSEPSPYYVDFTVNSLVSNWLFSLILALSLFL